MNAGRSATHLYQNTECYSFVGSVGICLKSKYRIFVLEKLQILGK